MGSDTAERPATALSASVSARQHNAVLRHSSSGGPPPFAAAGPFDARLGQSRKQRLHETMPARRPASGRSPSPPGRGRRQGSSGRLGGSLSGSRGGQQQLSESGSRRSREGGGAQRGLQRTKSEVRRSVRTRAEELKAAEKGTKALLQFAIDNGEVSNEEGEEEEEEKGEKGVGVVGGLPAPRFSQSPNGSLRRMASTQGGGGSSAFEGEESYHAVPCLSCFTDSRHAAIAVKQAAVRGRMAIGSPPESEPLLPECTPSTCLTKALEQVVQNVPLRKESGRREAAEAVAAASSMLPESRLASGRHREAVSPSRLRPATSGSIPNSSNPWRTVTTDGRSIEDTALRPTSSARASRQVVETMATRPHGATPPEPVRMWLLEDFLGEDSLETIMASSAMDSLIRGSSGRPATSPVMMQGSTRGRQWRRDESFGRGPTTAIWQHPALQDETSEEDSHFALPGLKDALTALPHTRLFTRPHTSPAGITRSEKTQPFAKRSVSILKRASKDSVSDRLEFSANSAARRSSLDIAARPMSRDGGSGDGPRRLQGVRARFTRRSVSSSRRVSSRSERVDDRLEGEVSRWSGKTAVSSTHSGFTFTPPGIDSAESANHESKTSEHHHRRTDTSGRRESESEASGHPPIPSPVWRAENATRPRYWKAWRAARRLALDPNAFADHDDYDEGDDEDDNDDNGAGNNAISDSDSDDDGDDVSVSDASVRGVGRGKRSVAGEEEWEEIEVDGAAVMSWARERNPTGAIVGEEALEEYAHFHQHALQSSPSPSVVLPLQKSQGTVAGLTGVAVDSSAFITPHSQQLANMRASPAGGVNAVSPTFKLRRRKSYFDGLRDATPDPSYPDRSAEEARETTRQESAWERQQLLGPVLYLLAADQTPKQRAEIRAREARWAKALQTPTTLQEESKATAQS